MNRSKEIEKNFYNGNGILRLAPNFLPRRFGEPGYRLRLHPDDYYPFGIKRGAIKERWFSSVITAINDEDAPKEEGLSYIISDNDESKISFKEVVDTLGEKVIGKELYNQYKTWPMFAKFFDYQTPLFHHIHLMQEHAELVGKNAKPEAYYFPSQLNNYPGKFPYTFFGFDPSVTKEEVKERLKKFESDDNKITELSRAYRIELDTGWYIPAGVIHAPGSYLTYEPQLNSDVNSVFENVVGADHYPKDMLVENIPEDKKNDYDFIIELLDWEKNIDPDFKKNYFRPSITANSTEGTFIEKWITYNNEYFSAKKLIIYPNQTITIKDEAAYGCIVIQGYGQFGDFNASVTNMVRYGEQTADEFFVSEDSAENGVRIVNESSTEPMVILKHFGPNNTFFTKNGNGD